MTETTSRLTRPRMALAHAKPSSHPGPLGIEADLSSFLNHTYHALLDSNGNGEQVNEALDRLFDGLYLRRLSSTDEEWHACIQQCRSHPLRETIHEDPFTRRAFSKPRGYAGDAELIDLIYGPEERWPEPEATALGLDIYRYTTGAPAAEGVRARRGFIADLIDRTTAEKPGQHILAVAAGHLREAEMISALRRRKIGRMVALDADPVSMKEVDRAYGSYGVETVAAPFKTLITNGLQLGHFDLVYSTGLFDYLNQSTGQHLVMTLFRMLRPGGKLVVANFIPGIRDVGFMETYMDWNLIYRNRHSMVDLTAPIDESEIRDITLFTEESRNIIFVQVTKQ